MKQRVLAVLAALLFLPGLAQAKIFLVDTDDTLRVVTASGVSTMHMYAAWADLTTTALTPGNSDAQVTTATTTVLVAAPGASTQRQIKGLSIRNAHASSSNVITVQFFDGVTATELIQYTLLAGETLQWGEDENFRVIDASGQVKGAVVANAGTNLNTSALLTTTAHDAAFGTAGTPDAQVRSVQGIPSMTPFLVNPGTATNFGVYAEDSVHASGDNLILAGAVQQSTDAALAGDGDRTALQVDATGYLKVVNKNPNLAADNSTNSTAKTPVLPGTVSTSAPTWTSGNQSALSLQTDGSVRAAITNTPTVTANAGTNLNTSALLTTSAHDAAFGTAGTADTQVRSVQGISGMTPIQVQSNSANLATAALQDGIIKDGTGDTTQANVSSGSLHVACQSGCSGGTQYAEDTAHVSGDTVTLAGVVQQSATAALAADGDRTVLQVDANGHLKVVNANPNLAADNSTNSTSKVPVIAALAGSSAPTWTSGNQVPLSVDTSGALRVTGGTSATQYTEDAASAGAESLTLAGAIRQNTPASSTSADGDYSNLKVDANGRLWVNGSDVTQPANVSQINGVTPLMGAGNTGTGSPRVTIATDQAALTGMGVYAEDAAETAGGNLSMVGTVRRDTAATSSSASGDNSTLNTDASGLLWTRTIDACTSGAKTFLPINISTATTTEITPSLAGASNNYYICSLLLVTAAANNVALTDDDSDGCGSVTSGLAGGTTAGSGFNLAANSGMTFGNGTGSIFKTGGTNRVICLVTSAATQLSGTMSVVAAP